MVISPNLTTKIKAVSVTERGTYKRCKRKWNYSSFNRMGLEPVINRPALIVGTLVHAALAAWTTDSEVDIEGQYLEFAAREIQGIREAYLERVGAPVSEDELGTTYDEVEIGMSMVRNYVQKWGQPLPDGYRLVEPEQTCLVEIPGTGGGQLEATLDGLVIDDAGLIWVLERKTYGQRPKLESLMTNDQFLAYCWVAQQLDIGPLGGVLYDGLWKRDGSYSKHTLDDLFMRHTIIRPQEEIDEFQHNLMSEHMDMQFDAMVPERIYPNRRWEGCWDCAFERLCTAQSRDEDFEYVRDTYYKPRSRSNWITQDE